MSIQSQLPHLKRGLFCVPELYDLSFEFDSRQIYLPVFLRITISCVGTSPVSGLYAVQGAFQISEGFIVWVDSELELARRLNSKRIKAGGEEIYLPLVLRLL
jgi:hypothetical protein